MEDNTTILVVAALAIGVLALIWMKKKATPVRLSATDQFAAGTGQQLAGLLRIFGG